MKDDKVYQWAPPWGWPGIMVIKSAKMGRWSVILWIHTDEDWYDGYHWTFSYWLQLRAWWPPVYFYRGWVCWD